MVEPNRSPDDSGLVRVTVPPAQHFPWDQPLGMEDHQSEHKSMTSNAWLDDTGRSPFPPGRESAAGARATPSAPRTSPWSWATGQCLRGLIGTFVGPTSGSPSLATPCARLTAEQGPENGSKSPAAVAPAAQEPPLPPSPSSTACRRGKPSAGSGPTTTTAPWKPRGNDCGFALSSNH
jgi:hypothetical protein